METGGRPRPDHLSLLAALAARPEEHHVFQALRVIEAHHHDAPRLGESRRPREDRVRMGQEVSLAFPPNTLTKFIPGAGNSPGRLSNLWFGFFGPQGPLPLHLTEFARDRLRNHRDPTFVAFADMLTHRLMSLSYRAWAASRPAPSFDRGDDPFEQWVAALAGFKGMPMLERDAMPDMARRHFAGHLASGTKTVEGLVSILSAFFDVPVAVQQFVGCWLELEPGDRWELGAPAGLGRSTSIGARVWSRAAKFRIRLGPLGLEEYERLLPGGDSQRRLESIVRTYVGDALDWEVNLVLAGDEVPRSSLGGTTRLGHTSWSRDRDAPEEGRPDADDLILYPEFQHV
ncbi:type VI secretion system protein ImpH [Cribrihabitans marinus]|uniref:Type VI secretion system protein ImpH n=1 Tax=Cribrihabitans marinus TaxID=1227549 RepID=A0A1H7DPN1_9RHOB|nr:type VI secretion system baseplate subunit TssG [Cribrihabitans marinus]SEK03354.1 type VI secretion system protein ImpH [Cribrihabitans marinus]